MPTFSYLTKDVINSLNLIEKENDNLLLGSFCGAVIELLGTILLLPQRAGSGECFKKFIEKFLSKRDPAYDTYKDLLWDDLRNGGAHSILPKGGIVLTGDKRESSKHLKIGRDPDTRRIYLVIFTPKFLDDLRQSVLEFVSEAQKDPTLASNYKNTILGIVRDGKKSIVNKLNRSGLKIDFQGRLKGDIHI